MGGKAILLFAMRVETMCRYKFSFEMIPNRDPGSQVEQSQVGVGGWGWEMITPRTGSSRP